jgi:hypothetical protein
MIVVTNGQLDPGTWETISLGQTEWLARKSRGATAEAIAGQDHRGAAALPSCSGRDASPSAVVGGERIAPSDKGLEVYFG